MSVQIYGNKYTGLDGADKLVKMAEALFPHKHGLDPNAKVGAHPIISHAIITPLVTMTTHELSEGEGSLARVLTPYIC